MAAWALGLRGKSLLALLLACLLALLPAGLIGWSLLESIRNHFGDAYARNFTLLNRERILAPVARELALSLRLADSLLLRRMLADEGDSAARDLMFAEAEGFRRDLRSGSYFLISAASGNYYFNERGQPFSAQPRYQLDADDPEDGWFYATLKESRRYNLNVNYDAKLGQTRIWINALVRDGDRVIGLAGSGLDLSEFLREFIARAGSGVTPMITTADGGLQAHPDPQRIALNSAEQTASIERSLYGLVAPQQRARVAELLARSRAAPADAQVMTVLLDGKPQLLSASYLPELGWHVLTALDLGAAEVLEAGWLLPIALGAGVVLLALLLGFAYAVERLVLRPLRSLQRSADAIAAGDYAVALPVHSDDEIGQLNRAFAVMADTVRRHTRELEDKVLERTSALQEANAQMLAAHRKIDDSIDYASLIQRAILPDADLDRLLRDRHFLLWRPRDVVGGDFYVFRSDGDNFLIGVCDCAGHGVPGALMTMLARSAIDHALATDGPADPASILAHVDATMRRTLAESQLSRALATNTDAGLVYVDRAAGELRFAGAAIALFHTDGEQIEQLIGSRRALGDARGGDYHNRRLPLSAGTTYHLVTDGLLDQAGGDHGYGFGTSRFRELMLAHANRPLHEQAAALEAALADWQGERPQRDDITVLSFRID